MLSTAFIVCLLCPSGEAGVMTFHIYLSGPSYQICQFIANITKMEKAGHATMEEEAILSFIVIV